MRRLATALTALFIAATAQAQTLRTEVVAHGLVNPWSLAFLPDGRMLVTERPGRLRLVAANGTLSAPIAGLPPVAAANQCGLLEVLPDPQFTANQRIYWSYAEPDRERRNGLAVARGTLKDGRLDDVQVIWRQSPKVSSSAHCGGKLAWGRDGRLFITTGDRFSEKDRAPKPDNTLGKVVRIEASGAIPADNPLAKTPGAQPEIWSMGHRNVQGAAIHPVSGALWVTEHGPQGGDELNISRAGANYGWPVITYGRNYGLGTRIGEGTEAPGVTPPLRHWAPTSVAPSGLAFITSPRYGKDWQGSLLVGTLRAQALLRLTLDGERVTGEERLLEDLHTRIRDVRQGPDGWVYLVTDAADGQILRMVR
ncbi:MAG: PQQ-dependent sugar dehydrogenase [Proteobacteria bacterium]|nr:PQQ-dependent sugar dehydrogenase [Pseudomonadota bacterium]